MVLDGPFIKVSIILYWSQFAIFLFDEEEGDEVAAEEGVQTEKRTL